MMKKTILFTICTIFLVMASQTVFAQDSSSKVANYSTGKYGQSNYEHFSFWTDGNGKAGEVTYRYGKDAAELSLIYTGVSSFKGMKGFEVKFPDGKIYFISPKTNKTIRVIGKSGKYDKTFRWEYEGPVDGIGTFCTPCTEDAAAAYQLLKNSYL